MNLGTPKGTPPDPAALHIIKICRVHLIWIPGNLLIRQVKMTKLIPITGIFRRNLPKIKEVYVIRNPEVIGVITLMIRE